ncbi:bacillithiol system redox-active protein YtxJ [Chryseobacterium lacus]|uniref:Bacillithiol system redox-active protein YtxJ n=1 Tax=Chryseobacterium lacus TaxID=2058346 RepID=A0A368MWV0_9FLAO|nr:bacillithiol system redox-active protein YtxJ [Chryseobacterium lacus]ODS90081.1 MAG: general stress protein [Chryseobacterium sp. SCN 40-13]RCU42737.1 bacillithiol system redox-active protein YtxJ [Chryseobacterium lacus]RST27300.1 bacillithiol system redox-active protein YtxJ [Chryseobacterium lacus]
MSFFKTLFTPSAAEDPADFWKLISSETDVEEALADSYGNKVVIFKHSTRCHISKRVLKNFEKQVKKSDKEAIYYFLDLLSYRSISDAIAERLEVQHQSPQMIVVENGIAVRNASHQNISLDIL